MILSMGYSSGGSVLQLIGLIVLCAIVVAASYVTTRYVGKKQLGNAKKSNFKVLEMYRVSQNKVIQLIQIGERYFVIAVCKDTMSLIAELQKEEIHHWPEEVRNVGFAEILSGFGKKQKKNNDSKG